MAYSSPILSRAYPFFFMLSHATGYRQWHNYDLFASIAYNYIKNSTELKLQKTLFSILEGCANIRYNANNLFEAIKLRYLYLK